MFFYVLKFATCQIYPSSFFNIYAFFHAQYEQRHNLHIFCAIYGSIYQWQYSGNTSDDRKREVKN